MISGFTPFGTLVFSIIPGLIGLLILYFVIYKAVKDGINKSMVGKLIEEKHKIKDKKSFLDSDLDNEK